MTESIASVPSPGGSGSIESTPITTQTESNPIVNRPLVSPKPYDDDMLDAYADEAAEDETPKEEKTTQISKKDEQKTELKTDSEAKPEEAEPKLEDTTLTRKINGKDVEFKVADAIKAYENQETFNRNMDRRATAMSQKEQKWVADQQSFKGKIDTAIKECASGNFVGAVRGFAKLAAADNPEFSVAHFEKLYFDQLNKVGNVYKNMTPEQQKAYFAEREASDARARVKELEAKETERSEKSALEGRVQAMQQKEGLSPEEFWGNYKFLAENLVGKSAAFKSVDDITPETVVQYSKQVRHEAKVLEAGKKSGISDNAVIAKLSTITQNDPTLSVDDLVEIINKSGLISNADPKSVENLNRKVGKSNTRFNQVSSTKKQNGKIEGYDEESLNDLYRKSPRVYARPVR